MSKPTLLSLPIEVIAMILDATHQHPEQRARDASVNGRDPRSHGWRPFTTFDEVKQWQQEYSTQVVPLLQTCKTFYRYLVLRLYAAPVLTTPGAISKFYRTIKSSRYKTINKRSLYLTNNLHALVTTLALYPLQSGPSAALITAWSQYLEKYFKHLTALRTFAPGIWASLLTFEHIFASFLEFRSLENLDQIDLFVAFTQLDPCAAQDGVLTLMNAAAPKLKRVSFSTINLLEKGCGVQQRSKFVLLPGATLSPNRRHGDDFVDFDDDEDEHGLPRFVEEYSAEDSCAARFLGILRAARVGVEWDEAGPNGTVVPRRETGIESVYFYGETAIGVGVFGEMLENMPNLRCFHLDAFTMMGPSFSPSIPFYDPLKQRLSLKQLSISLGSTSQHLTELTFAPLFAGQISTTGKMDELLVHLPHVIRLELRADFITPSFFRPLVPTALPATATASSHPLRYLALHVLPPHAPPTYFVSTSSHTVAPTTPNLQTAMTAPPAPPAPPRSPSPPARPEEDSDSEDGLYGHPRPDEASSASAPVVKKTVAVTVCQFFGTDEIGGLARAVEDLFFSSNEASHVVDPGTVDGRTQHKQRVVSFCEWPNETQEEFGGTEEEQRRNRRSSTTTTTTTTRGRPGRGGRGPSHDDDDDDDVEEKFPAPVWYDLIMRLGKIGTELGRRGAKNDDHGMARPMWARLDDELRSDDEGYSDEDSDDEA
ncbi:hypothetical protein JCM10212_003806 [Sporobolomyces blumeae]